MYHNIKPLTKKQLFDLEIKYPDINQFGKTFRIFYPSNEKYWYKNPKVWKEISEKCKLTEDFMREFKDYIHWGYACRRQTLSEDFIREFQYLFKPMDWQGISYYQTFTENFMREFKDKLDWEMIIEFQNISYEFKQEMKKEGYIKE